MKRVLAFSFVCCFVSAGCGAADQPSTSTASTSTTAGDIGESTSETGSATSGARLPECEMTAVGESYLNDSTTMEAVLDGPLGPTVAALEAGGPLPQTPPSAATWTSGDLDSLTIVGWLNCPQLAEQLLELGADPDGLTSNSPAFQAALGGSWPVVYTLLEGGADPALIQDSGDTIVSLAATDPQADRLASVIEYTQPEDLAGPVGAISLGMAVTSNRLDNTALLIDEGASLTVNTLVDSTADYVDAAIFERLLEAATEDADRLDRTPEMAFNFCYVLTSGPEESGYSAERFGAVETLLAGEVTCE